MNEADVWGFYSRTGNSPIAWQGAHADKGSAEAWRAECERSHPSSPWTGKPIIRGPVQRRSDPNPFDCRVADGPRDEEVREFGYDRRLRHTDTCPGCGAACPCIVPLACAACVQAHGECCVKEDGREYTGAEIAKVRVEVRDRIYAHAKRLRDEAGMRPIRGVGGKVIGHAQRGVTLYPVQSGPTVTLERAIGVGCLAELLHATDPRVLAFVADRADPGVTVAKVWACNESGWRAEAEERAKRMVEAMGGVK